MPSPRRQRDRIPRTARPALAVLVLLAGLSSAAAQAPDEGARLFESRIRPLLAERCMGCHDASAGEVEGGLALDSRQGWSIGGDSGPALVPGDPAASLLVRAVRYRDDALKMPPDGRLDADEIRDLERWVALGAPDPRDGEAPAATSGFDPEAAAAHWAYRPISRPAPPRVRDETWPRGPLDRFLLAAMEARGLRPAAPADRRRLLRRASFDLRGLPPTLEEVEDFLGDREPGAWERVVDRLLASPHYGEKQARAWLDLARYADSNGLDENLAHANAWRYRDWVIRAFDADKPWDEFLVEQIAGDLLPALPGEEEGAARERVVATGFLCLGPKMLAEQDKEKLVMDVVDEQIDVLFRAVTATTVGCARCHDHKFDPVRAEDYYALAGIFRSTSSFEDLGFVSKWREREIPSTAERAARTRWEEERRRASAVLEQRLAEARAASQAELRGRIDEVLLAADALAARALLIEAEDASRTNLAADDAHWGGPGVAVLHTASGGQQHAEWDLVLPRGGRYALALRYAAQEKRPLTLLVDGVRRERAVAGEVSGGWKPANQRWFAEGVVALRPGRNVLRLEREGSVPHLDKLLLVRLDAEGVAAAGEEGPPAPLRGALDFLVTTERLGVPGVRLVHALRALPEATFAAGVAALGREVAERGALEGAPVPAPLRALLRPEPPSDFAEAARRLRDLLLDLGERGRAAPEELDDESRALLDLWLGERGLLSEVGGRATWSRASEAAVAAAEAALAEVAGREPPGFAAAMCVAEGEVRDLPVHVRGSHLRLDGEAVPRGAIAFFERVCPAPDMPEARSGRLELARWLTHPEHPLTARVAVNRIWQGLFGRGLVTTPSNFGLRGDRPSHPELLDWLARRFVELGWSVKSLQREILLSSAYRMDSAFDAENFARDPEERCFWRKPPRRLQAEELRDALLAVSGSLDRARGGSLLATGNRDYVTNDQSKDAARYDARRRAIYLPVIRNAIYDLFSTFDYNDPSAPMARRTETTVPHQALLLLNSPLVREEAGRLATAALGEPVDDGARVGFLFRRVLLRDPEPSERAAALRYLAEAMPAGATGEERGEAGPRGRDEETAERRRAWRGLAQALLASNEFLHLD